MANGKISAPNSGLLTDQITISTSYGKLYYSKILDHIVVLQTDGWLNFGTPTSSGWVTLATLPAGFRPKKSVRFAAGTNGSIDTGKTQEVEITTAGEIKVYQFGNKANRPEFFSVFYV